MHYLSIKQKTINWYNFYNNCHVMPISLKKDLNPDVLLLKWILFMISMDETFLPETYIKL